MTFHFELIEIINKNDVSTTIHKADTVFFHWKALTAWSLPVFVIMVQKLYFSYGEGRFLEKS